MKVGVLTGSVLAAGYWPAVLLRIRNRHYRSIFELETADPDCDGVPDVYLPGRNRPATVRRLRRCSNRSAALPICSTLPRTS